MSKHEDVFKQLQAHFGNQVAWVDARSPVIPSGYPWVMQVRSSFDMSVGETKMEVRTLKIGESRNKPIGKWQPLNSLQTMQQLITANLIEHTNSPVIRERNRCNTVANKQGAILLDALGAEHQWCEYNKSYKEVLIPGWSLVLEELECLLKFEMWKGKEPHRRKWRSAL